MIYDQHWSCSCPTQHENWKNWDEEFFSKHTVAGFEPMTLRSLLTISATTAGWVLVFFWILTSRPLMARRPRLCQSLPWTFKNKGLACFCYLLKKIFFYFLFFHVSFKFCNSEPANWGGISIGSTKPFCCRSIYQAICTHVLKEILNSTKWSLDHDHHGRAHPLELAHTHLSQLHVWK